MITDTTRESTNDNLKRETEASCFSLLRLESRAFIADKKEKQIMQRRVLASLYPCVQRSNNTSNLKTIVLMKNLKLQVCLSAELSTNIIKKSC